MKNPEAYEQVLKKELEVDPLLDYRDYGRFWEFKEKRYWNYEYEYAFNNDGRSMRGDLDNLWPFRAEYFHYKDWVDSIRDKALDTLKLTVSRLLHDFKNMPEMNNQIVVDQRGKNETKHQALTRIY